MNVPSAEQAVQRFDSQLSSESFRFPAGTEPARHEDLRLVTGTGRYAADWHYPDMLHAYVIRASLAHARIIEADFSEVLADPQVVAVLTADDVESAGFGPLPNAVTNKAKDGSPQRQVLMPVLASDRVLFAGQPIAMVIARSARAAQDAAERARIDFEALPTVACPADALAPNAPQLHAEAPGNLSLRFEAGDHEAVDRAFAAARFVSKLRVESQRLIPSPMEPRAVVAFHDRATQKTRLHAPNQGMVGMLNYLVAITKWPAESIEVVAQDVGGSFGIRSGAYSEHVLVMLAARKLGQAVRWVGSRSEVFLSDFHGRALALEGSIAMDEQGRFLGIRFHDEVDLGAFNCFFSTHIGTRNLSITMGGVYKVPALAMRSDLVFTNTVPVSAYRGAGRPDIAYAIERLVDHAAHEHGFDPVELRRLNFIAPENFPYTTANGTVYDSGDFHQVLRRALDMADYAGFSLRQQEAAAQGKLRGIGLACYLEASGPGGAPKDQVEASFTDDGLMNVYAVTGASGQGHETSFAQLIESELGWPAARVRYRAGDPAHHLIGNSTGGSRTLYGAGSAVKAMCTALREKLKQIAQAQGQAHESLFDPTALIDELILAGRAPELTVIGEATSGATFPNGCHCAEVEIDPDTGVTTVIHYVAVDDLGRVISPKLVQGQVHGGVVQGWGQAFCEHAIYDRGSAQLLTGSYMDYAMPRAGCVPAISNATINIPTGLNLLGAKGVGESGCSGSLPALANAVIAALRPLGVKAMDMPFTPAKVWAAIQQSDHAV